MQSLGYSYPWGPTNQFRPTTFFLLPSRIFQRGEWKLKQMKSWSLLQGGTNLSKEIQVHWGGIEHYQIKRLDKNIDGAFRSSAL